MTALGKQDLEKLRDFTNEETIQKWLGLEKRLSVTSKKITIANTGLVNSGKSSLFNALLDSFDKRRFPEGAVRTTTRGDREKFTNSIDILDTPGIDAKDGADDAVAFKVLMEADLIVAVHNIHLGMLNRSEYEWLSHIAKHMKKDEIKKRVIFVCTWIDQSERQTGYESALKTTKEQVFEAFGTEIPFWEVSAKRYFTGHEKNRSALINASKIPQFKAFLLERASEIQSGISKQRYAEFLKLCKEIHQKLRNQQNMLQKSKAQKISEIENDHSFEFEAWNAALTHFDNLRDTVWDELREISYESGMAQFVDKIDCMK